MAMVSSLEEQLQIRTSKLATLEKVLGNTRRHLQDAVENVRETEQQYLTKIEEIEQENEDERAELQDKIMEVQLHMLPKNIIIETFLYLQFMSKTFSQIYFFHILHKAVWYVCMCWYLHVLGYYGQRV